MRNIDYRELYHMVLENEKKGQWDGLTQDQRTAKEIASNKARTMSVAQAKNCGIGTGKKGVAPTAPPNLIPEEVQSIKETVIEAIRGMDTDEIWELMAFIDEQITAGKNFNSSGLDMRTPQQKMNNIKGSVKQNDKIQGMIQPPKGL